ncbi:hypothetical protein [Enterobacter kobei]|uniref:hypothetical protein n=1 Tax=Enterobacter kobei TaxID=208224 RepID=UPI003076497D
MSELVKRGHDQAAELKSSCGASVAQLISDLATQLDCTALALREMTKKRDADHADVLAWEKTMFKACGEDCLKSVAEKFAELQARCARLAAENAGLREYRPQPSGAAMMEALDAFYEYHEDVPEQGMMAAFEILCCKRPSTPATDAFLAEVRAQGVERLANAWYAIANETDPGISISDSSRLKYRQRADDAADFANEIRQEAAQ